MRILFATTILPHGETSGGEIASQAFIDALRALGHDVTVFGFPRKDGDIPSGSVAMPIRPIEMHDAGLARGAWMAKSLLSGRPYVNAKFQSDIYRRRLVRAAKERPDLLVLDHAQMGWLLPDARRLARRMIFIAHNHEAGLYARQAELAAAGSIKCLLLLREARLLEGLETALAQRADAVWTLSETEQSVFDNLAETAKSRLMPVPGRRMPPDTHQAPICADIGLLGTWGWDVNRAGLLWFLNEVLPLLPTHVRVWIGGRGSETLCATSIKSVGFVDDPIAFIRSVRVFAIPSIIGAGIQIKTVEAIAAGARIVSTPLGVRGIENLPDHVSLARTAEEFAAALVTAIAQPPLAPTTGQDWAQDRRTRFNAAIAESLARFETSPNLAHTA